MNFRAFALSSFRAFALSAFCLCAFCFLPLASFAQTIPDEIFGEYIGDMHITNDMFGIDETIPEITVEVENRNVENDYFISIPDLAMMGIEIPVELDQVIITPFADGYKLSRAESLSFTLENVFIPAIPPLIPEGYYDIPVVISLENSDIIEYVLNLNLKVVATITYYIGPVPIPLSTTFNIAFKGVTEAPPPPPVIITTSLPSGIEEQEYNALLEATGETPITWSIIDGELPTGITLNPLTGSISGTPTEANIFSFTVQAENIGGVSSQLLSIEIEEKEEDTVGIRKPEIEMFKVYPNPTTGELRITNYELRITGIEIFDISGKKLSNHLITSSSNHLITSSSNHLINISQLPAGVYIIKIQTDKGVYKQQFIKK